MDSNGARTQCEVVSFQVVLETGNSVLFRGVLSLYIEGNVVLFCLANKHKMLAIKLAWGCLKDEGSIGRRVSGASKMVLSRVSAPFWTTGITRQHK